MALVSFSHMKFILTLSFSARNLACNPTWSITHIAFIYIIPRCCVLNSPHCSYHLPHRHHHSLHHSSYLHCHHYSLFTHFVPARLVVTPTSIVAALTSLVIEFSVVFVTSNPLQSNGVTMPKKPEQSTKDWKKPAVIVWESWPQHHSVKGERFYMTMAKGRIGVWWKRYARINGGKVRDLDDTS